MLQLYNFKHLQKCSAQEKKYKLAAIRFNSELIFSISGISSLDSKASGKMGVRAVVYYMVTTLIAVFIGIVIVIIIRPGKGSRDSPVANSGNIEPVQAADAFLDLIR